MVEVAVEAGWLAVRAGDPDPPLLYVGGGVFHPYGSEGCGDGPYSPDCHVDLEPGVTLPADEVRYLHWCDTWHGDPKREPG